MNHFDRRYLLKAVVFASPLLAGSFLTSALARAADDERRKVKVKIHNGVTNDIRVGIFGWDEGVDYRQNIPAGDTVTAHLYPGWRGIIVWDNDAQQLIPEMGGVARFHCEKDNTAINVMANRIDIIAPTGKE